MIKTWKGSPNHDKNRKPIDRVVIHWFGKGTLASANTHFHKPGGTSAHYGVSDSTVWQWVREKNVAYHAGNYKMNQRSIGIEHDATKTKTMSDTTYKTAAALLGEVSQRHNIPLDRAHVIGHKEVPRATQCPGTINIDRLLDMAKSIIGEDMPTYLPPLLKEDLGLDIDKTEGEVRSRIGELKHANETYKEQEARIKDLEKKVAFESGQAAKFEEELILASKGRERLEKEIDAVRKQVVTRDTEIGKLSKAIDTLKESLDPETKIVISKDEYERLIKHKTLDRHTKREIARELIRRILRRG